jgi:hypothetical protein
VDIVDAFDALQLVTQHLTPLTRRSRPYSAI